jgi:DNA polymerase-3 subunit epsilon
MSVVDASKGALSVKLLSEVTFCVLDLETTGSSPGSSSITEIGAIKYRGGHEIGRFETFINPETSIPAAIVLLTGITDSMVRDAPKIGEVLEELLTFIGDSVFVAHNARFDLGFVNSALLMHDHAELRNEVVDTVSLARRLVRNEVPNCKLRTLAA